MDYMPYSPDMDDQRADANSRRGGKAAVLLRLAIFLCVVLLCVGAGYWAAQKFPDKMTDLIIAVDRFGITDAGAREQQRVRTINRLGITYEEKQVLIKRTVFLSATREMVYLALGDPVCVLQRSAAAEPATEYWVYYIEGDRKPTALAFQNNELISAGKASALDTCK